MKKNKAYDLSTYPFGKDEPLLLDTNVWLYLFPAPSDRSSSWSGVYSAAFKTIRTAGCQLAMDVLVLSEYLNRYCRIEWAALHRNTHPDFKKFRKSPDFVGVGQGAATYARSLLKLCTAHDHPFGSSDLGVLLADFEAGHHDFNDGLLAETCQRHGWKLVTNDGDFTTGGIEVITANRTLLRNCA